ncbi:MAG: NERD domain-containing protein [Brachybacterium sp.]|nr:NERD domain-containing protein [Brachybacterium sp.]
MTSTHPTAVRAPGLAKARARIGTGLFLYTLLIAVLWVMPKGDLPPVWLICLLPALVFVLLTWKMVGKGATHASQMGRVIGFGAILAVLWVSGSMLLSSGGVERWFLYVPWWVMHALWPLVMAVGITARFTLRKLVPGAARRDSERLHHHREELRREEARRAKQDSIEKARLQEIEYDRKMQRETNSQLQPTAPGRLTGLEPSALAAVEVPTLPDLFGTPGAGLSGSGFGADQITKGQDGELNFARALQHTDQLSRFATFWSVHMPDETVGASTTYSSDIDCVVVTGSSIFLLDMKNYTQGDVTWIQENDSLRLIDNPTGGYIGKARSMSRNMELAADRVQKKFRALGVGHQVKARVVFMPTDNGIGTIDSEVSWPGEIRAENLDETLAELSAEPAFEPTAADSEHIVRVFRWLVKDETGSAPRLGEAWKNAPGMRRPRPGNGVPAAAPSTAPAAPSADAVAPAPQATAQSTPPEHATAVTAAPARTCEECGASFGSEWTFCWECGRA